MRRTQCRWLVDLLWLLTTPPFDTTTSACSLSTCLCSVWRGLTKRLRSVNAPADVLGAVIVSMGCLLGQEEVDSPYYGSDMCRDYSSRNMVSISARGRVPLPGRLSDQRASGATQCSLLLLTDVERWVGDRRKLHFQ